MRTWKRCLSGLYTIPYHLQQDNTRNIAVVHTYVHPKMRTKEDYYTKKGKKGKKGAKTEITERK